MNKKTEWRPIKDLPGYEISIKKGVRSMSYKGSGKPKILKDSEDYTVIILGKKYYKSQLLYDSFFSDGKLSKEYEKFVLKYYNHLTIDKAAYFLNAEPRIIRKIRAHIDLSSWYGKSIFVSKLNITYNTEITLFHSNFIKNENIEEWRPLQHYNHYLISNLGRVRYDENNESEALQSSQDYSIPNISSYKRPRVKINNKWVNIGDEWSKEFFSNRSIPFNSKEIWLTSYKYKVDISTHGRIKKDNKLVTLLLDNITGKYYLNNDFFMESSSKFKVFIDYILFDVIYFRKEDTNQDVICVLPEELYLEILKFDSSAYGPLKDPYLSREVHADGEEWRERECSLPLDEMLEQNKGLLII